MAARKAAWVTLLTKTCYIQGALVLDKSLRTVRSAYPLVVMAAPQLPPEAREILRLRQIPVRDIDYLQPQEGRHHVAEHDARFRETWTKLEVFDLAEYHVSTVLPPFSPPTEPTPPKRVVLLDSDMIVRQNMDELMDLDRPPDWIAGVHACACNPMQLPHYPEDW